jgi:hypothetical protein
MELHYLDYGTCTGIAVADGFAYVAVEEPDLLIIDVTDPTSPTVIDSFTIMGRSYGVEVAGSHNYIVGSRPGRMEVVDISNPSSARLIGGIDLPDYGRQAIVAGEHVFIANYGAGLRVAPAQCDPTSDSRELDRAIGPMDVLSVTPNPIRGEALLRFRVGQDGGADLRVCDVTGRSVRRLHEGTLADGWHQISWDGRDDRGRAVATGVYFVHLSGDRYTETRSVVVLR